MRTQPFCILIHRDSKKVSVQISLRILQSKKVCMHEVIKPVVNLLSIVVKIRA